MEENKVTCVDEAQDKVKVIVKDRSFVATCAAVGVGLITKKFSKDAALSIGAALVAYAVAKKV